MKHIAIIGATGSTGTELVRLALEANYKVSALVRNPDHFQFEKNVTATKGDVTDLISLELALQNVDYAISCFGPSNHRKVGNLMSVGTINIVKACEKNVVKRCVFMSGFVQSDYNELSLLNKLIVPIFRLYFNQSYKDKIIAETAIQNSIVLLFVIVPFFYMQHPKFGKAPKGIRLEKIKQSSYFKNGKFQNLSITPDLAEGHNYFEVIYNNYFKQQFKQWWVGLN